MNKFKLAIISALAASSLMAYVPQAPKKAPMSPEEKAALAEKRLQKTGGVVYKQGEGKIVIVNAQSKYQPSDIERALALFNDFLRVNIEVRQGTWKFGDGVPEDAKLAIYLVDDTSLPMSLVAVESHWGVMNVAKLMTPKQFDVEFARVGILTFGSGVSQYKASPMQTVSAPGDLDSIVKPAITVDSGMGMNNNLEKLGVTKTKMSTYRKACQEGWAAAPTNSYQKAIWDEIHTLPSTPLSLSK